MRQEGGIAKSQSVMGGGQGSRLPNSTILESVEKWLNFVEFFLAWENISFGNMKIHFGRLFVLKFSIYSDQEKMLCPFVQCCDWGFARRPLIRWLIYSHCAGGQGTYIYRSSYIEQVQCESDVVIGWDSTKALLCKKHHSSETFVSVN